MQHTNVTPPDDPQVSDRLFAAEDRHFWFGHRNEVIADVFRRLTAELRPGYRVLEVGCGNANVLRVLEDVCAAGAVVGLEPDAERAALARRRVRCPLVPGDVYRMAFPDPFQLIGMFDVLEHLADDVGAMAGVRAALAPGGAAVLTVPAHMELWSHVDVFAGHHRRYTPATLTACLTAAGLRVGRVSQFMLPVAPLMWAGRGLAAWRRARTGGRESDAELAVREFDIPGPANAALRCLLRFERAVLKRGRGMPVGSSLLAVAYRDPPGGGGGDA